MRSPARLLAAGVAVLATAALAVVPTATVGTSAAAASTRKTVIDPMGGSPTSISCPTTSFCLAVDTYGKAVTFDAGSWSAPTAVDGEPSGLTQDYQLQAVSCTSATFCAVTARDGDVLRFDGSQWTRDAGALGVANEGSSAISCPSETYCLAVVGTDFVTFNGSTWTTHQPAEAPNGGHLDSVSCVSQTFCVATDSVGNALQFDGAKWSADAGAIPGGSNAVSCVSATICFAAGATSIAAFDGANWSSPVQVDTHATALAALSCPSATFCLAVDHEGNAFAYDGASWTEQTAVDPEAGLQYVSCATAIACVAVDSYGFALRYDGSSWAAPVVVDHDTGALTSVSCADTSDCAAVDAYGNALIFKGGTWSSPHTIDPHDQFDSVSCASSSFCAAVGTQNFGPGIGGALAVYDGSNWTALPTATAWQSVSCPTTKFCMATSFYDATMTYDGTAWSAPTATGFGSFGGDVACVSAQLCMSGGFRFSGSTWTYTLGNNDPSVPNGPIACASAGYCAVPDGLLMYQYNGQSWALTNQGGAWGTGDLISCPLTTFCAVASNDGYVVAFADGAPEQPVRVDDVDVLTGSSVGALSCPTAGLCVLLDDTSAVTWNPGYLVAPTVTSQPHSTAAVAGRAAKFTALASGRPAPSVQWSVSTNGSTWSNVKGATATTLAVTATTTRWYRARFTSAAGTTVTSTAKLTVWIPPRITRQPASRRAVAGTYVTFRSAASGTPHPAVQWQLSTDHGHHWHNLRGAIHSSLTVHATHTRNGYRYRARFANIAGHAITTAASLAVA